MAHATIFPEANFDLGGGGNPDTYAMPAALAIRPQITKEMPYYVSRWQLSKEEVEEIVKTGHVYLCLMHTPVPSSIHAFNPFSYKYNGQPEFQLIGSKEN